MNALNHAFKIVCVDENNPIEYAILDEINKDNMWIDTVTMSNANDTINSNSEINKSISILVKLDGKSKETVENEIKNITIKVHIYNSKNEQKEITTINSKF